jgi:hypothetical protein
MPWWLTFALDWFPAVLVALAITWWLDLPLGATLVVFLLIAGVTRVSVRAWKRARGIG